MNSSDLIKFVDGEISSITLNELIKDEVEEFKKSMTKKGGTSPVYESGEQYFYEIKPEHISKLCEDYLNKHFTEYDIYYILTYLELSQSFSFQSEELFEIASGLSDPDVNGPLNDNFVNEVITELNTL